MINFLKVRVGWADGHETLLDHQWLYERAFTGQKNPNRKRLTKGLRKKFWGADYNIKRYSFQQVLDSDLQL